MNNQDPFEFLTSQIGDLLAKARDYAGDPLAGDPPPDLEARLTFLEEAVARFNETAKAQIAKEGITKEELKKKVRNDMESYPTQDKKLLKKTFEVGRDLISLKIGFDKAQEAVKSKERLKGKTGKKEALKRKSKFKKMGGDKWKKL